MRCINEPLVRDEDENLKMREKPENKIQVKLSTAPAAVHVHTSTTEQAQYRIYFDQITCKCEELDFKIDIMRT